MWTKSLLHSSRAHFGNWLEKQNNSQPNKGKIPVIKVTGNSFDRDGTLDTGLGSSSLQGSGSILQGEEEEEGIIGPGQTYSDATESTASNTSDGDYSENHKMTTRQSDVESTKTEDFEDKFREISRRPVLQEADRSSSKERKRGSGKRENHVSEEALKLHESRIALLAAGFYLDKYGKLRNKLMENSKRRGPSGKSKHHHHYGLPQQQNHRHHSTRKEGQSSDLDSLADDLESHLQNFLLKQVALSQNNGLDKLVDSDLETVKSLMVHKKFRRALYESGMTDPSELSSSDTESADDILSSRKHGPSMIPESPHSLPGPIRQYSLKTPDAKSKSPKHRRSIKGHSGDGRREPAEDHLSLQTKKILQELEKEQQLVQGEKLAAFGTGKMSGSTPELNAMTPKDVVNAAQLQHLLNEGGRLQDEVEKARREKQSMLQELKSIAGVLERNKSELRQAERQMREMRNKAQDAKNELVLVEYQKETSERELNKMADQLEVIKGHFGETQNESLPFDPEQVATLLAENESLKVKLQGQMTSEAATREVQELERQLNAAKEELFAEQKTFRTKLESLEEELDQKTQNAESLQKENETFQKKLVHLETTHQQMERDKTKMIKEKTLAYEDLRIGLEKQFNDLRNSTNEELQELRNQLTDVSKQLTKANSELSNREEQNSKLKEKIQQFQIELAQEGDAKARMSAEAKRNLETIRMDMDTAIMEIRRSAEEDKMSALENLKRRLEGKHEERMAQAEQNLMKQLQEVQNYLAARDVEVELLKDRLKQNEEITKQARDKLRHDTHDKVKQALEEERLTMMKAKEEEIELQVSRLQEEYQSNMERSRHELAVEKENVDQHSRQIKLLKKELEEARETNRQLYRDKLHAVDDARESLEGERENQLATIREHVEKETSMQMEKLKAKLQKQEKEIEMLKSEKQEGLIREKEMASGQERMDRGLVTELNEECRKLSELMGITPRIATVPSFSTTWTSKNGSSQNPVKLAIKSATSNLRALIQETTLHVKRTKQEVDNLRQNVVKTESSKSEEIDVMRKKLTSEKSQALEMLRDRLVKEHTEEVDRLHKSLNRGKDLQKSLKEKELELKEIQQNMAKWKEDMAEKLAKKFQEEMSRELEKRLKDHKKQQREWEYERTELKREIDKIDREKRLYSLNGVSGYSTPIRHRAPSPVISTTHSSPVRHLAGSAKGRDDAFSIKKRGFFSSMSDLTANHGTDAPNMASRISNSDVELKLAAVERRAKMAEERATKNEKELSKKLSEVSKLQGSLTQQTKELMQLKKAFTNLHQGSLSPSYRSAAR